VYCSDNNKRKTTPTWLIIVIVLLVLTSLVVGMYILWKFYWKGKSGDNEDYAMYEEETPLHIDIRRFTYAELKLITNNFQSIVGKGGFGIVYYGTLENGDEVAVKVLMETSIDESTDFLPEV
jgi:cbb3-type cytochrome oxidase maturation protein